MKKSRTLIALAIAVAGLVATETALAQHRRHHHHGHHHHHHGARLSIGFAFGVPLAAYAYPHFYPPHVYYPAYYPAPVVIRQPTVYVEQVTPPAPAVYWYFCADSRAYYPYVKECPSGWLRVAPHPG